MTEKEKTRRKSARQLKSLRNKMGNNLPWFDSLSKTRQYDLLFQWIRTRTNGTDRVKIIRILDISYKEYPPKLKHFIALMKTVGRYRPSKIKLRDTIIDLILNK